MRYNICTIIAVFLLLIFFVGCKGGEMTENTTQLPSIKDVQVAEWKKLSQKKIYFGHHSVGFNIIDGIKDLMKENPQIKLNIVETYNPTDLKDGIFAHSKVGNNRDPVSKTADFTRFIVDGIGNKADYAFFKFCYVDIVNETDIDNVFKDYKGNITKLKTTFPKTVFIHLTVPLKVVQTGIKAWIKTIIGKQIGGYAKNIKRNEYNKLLINEYSETDRVFDLAMVESTREDGTRQTFTESGKTYYSLNPDYTDDGGHLNEKGRKRLAKQLLFSTGFTGLLGFFIYDFPEESHKAEFASGEEKI